ncbi:uncharacterized protein C3orf20 homolog isoform X2 [Molossus molossus]|uniref:uncharacterized protein C3orf20 homolog isoform X2 n=1 Tax=Molossus molossus TaxID=27622 RepID=UPI001746FC9E|nr:uncharacterized protein C3orf20 homolog isoform X2 [Molossus molossus]
MEHWYEVTLRHPHNPNWSRDKLQPRSHGRMEDSTEAKSLATEPIYFFDQMKPKRKTWGKRKCKDHFPHLRDTSRATHSSTKSKECGELEERSRLSTVATLEENYEFHSSAILQTPSKLYLQKNLFEEYKLIAAEILCELGETLQKYAEYNITVPVGTVNLVNYNWHDLIEGAYECETKKSTLKRHSTLQSDCNPMTTVDKTNCSRIGCCKENHLVKAEKDHHHIASSKSTEKTSVLSQKQYCQISQDRLPVVIHFSLSSQICLENGWLCQYPYSKSEILKWKTVLNIAVKKLQGAIIQIKTEEAKLKKEGFNKQLILRHYNDPKAEEEVNNSPLTSPCFWLELLERKPQMPEVKEADPEMKKFHYALVDGSSMTYYPSGCVAVCQSYSALPFGGVYTNIFSDLPDQVILGTFTPFGCGSLSFPKSQIISMMFNQDGGMVISKTGNIIREWKWPLKGKLHEPVEISVNKFITVKISGRFTITLVYTWHPESLKLSLAPVKCKSFPPYFPEVPSSLSGLVDTSVTDISPMSDIGTIIKLKRLQEKAKHILFSWLDHYKFSLGMESLQVCKVPRFPQKLVGKQKVSPAEFSTKPSAKGKDETKEYLLYRNTFLKLTGVFKPSPLPRIHKTPASNQSFRPPLSIKSKDAWFASHLVCPVVLRQALCGKEGDTCRCSTYIIPEVTDLEYDHLISKKLSSVDQIIIVYVLSAKEKNKAIREVTGMYREQNRTRSMPCPQSHLDSFRFLKYNIISASKFTSSNCPLLVQRHNVIPGIFLVHLDTVWDIPYSSPAALLSLVSMPKSRAPVSFLTHFQVSLSARGACFLKPTPWMRS